MVAETAADFAAEFATLILPRFDETDALDLGRILIDLAKQQPVVINIRNANRVFFHAALPGSAALNDNWARRKSNTALLFDLPSMLVGVKAAETGKGFDVIGLNTADYADHGGAVPIQVTGVGVVACATVSGLPSIEDHRLVVRGIQTLAHLIRAKE